jgi:hypothetical protein
MSRSSSSGTSCSAGGCRPNCGARLILPLRLLLAAPYLVFLFRPGIVLAVVSVAVAPIGYAASLALQERFLAVVPEELRGQGLGLAGSGMMSAQALSATLVGLGAELSSPAMAMAGAAVGSLAVTAALSPGLREPAPTLHQ